MLRTFRSFISKETICGIIIGVTGVFFPIVLFSGEEEMADLMTTFGKYTPLFLIIVCLIKILMTSVCIKLGLKGGHFFPLIFACACMGYALAMYVFGDASAHVVFAAGIVTATTLGAQLKKPIAVALLLLLCFPVRFIFWLFLGAAIGSGVSSVFPKSSVNGDGA